MTTLLKQNVVAFLHILTRKPEIFFLITSLIAGLFVVFTLPPYRGLDEASHIFRVSQLSQGDLLMEKGAAGYGHPIPAYINQVNVYEFSQTEKTSVKEAIVNRSFHGKYTEASSVNQFQLFEGSGSYSPIIYAHYLPAGFIANQIKLNSYLYTLLLRISNLMLFIICAYFAIKIIPLGKWFFVAIALLPMSIHQASTVSADVILISSILLFIALVAKASVPVKKNAKNDKIKLPNYVLPGIFLSGLLIGGSKPGYILLVSLVFLLPIKLFSSKRKRLLYIGTLFISCLALLSIWAVALNNAGLSGAVETFRERVDGGKTYSATQIVKQTVTRPWDTGTLFLNTFIYEGGNLSSARTFNAVPDFIMSNFTGLFGSLNIPLPSWASFMVVLNLLIAFLGFKNTDRISNRSRNLVIITLCVQFVAIFIVFWKTWTQVGMTHIWGLQGRYFIPLLPLLVFVAPAKSIFAWNENRSKQLIILFSIIPLLIMCILVAKTFYNGLV